MFSIQLLIFYLSKENVNIEKSLDKILLQIPNYVKINQELKEFINRNEDFKIKHLLTIYEYIERFYYNEIRKKCCRRFSYWHPSWDKGCYWKILWGFTI